KLGKYRCVDDAQAAGPVNVEAAVDDRHRIVGRSDPATARRVVAPCVVLDEPAYLAGRAHAGTGHQLFGDDVAAARGDAPYRFDAFDHGCQVVHAAGAF